MFVLVIGDLLFFSEVPPLSTVKGLFPLVVLTDPVTTSKSKVPVQETVVTEPPGPFPVLCCPNCLWGVAEKIQFNVILVGITCKKLNFTVKVYQSPNYYVY